MDKNTEWIFEMLDKREKEIKELGKKIPPPKYVLGDCVKFAFDSNDDIIEGMIAIVDRYGTFEQNKEVSYDIYRFSNNTLYKHIVESLITDFVRHGELQEMENNIQKFIKKQEQNIELNYSN